MSTPRHPEDRALDAVRRVRDSREQDSRFGLQHALGVVRERDVELERARERRDTAPGFAQGSPSDFALHVARLGALAALEQRARENARDSRLVAEESRNRWQHDRQQRVVVERLLERRHEERRVERSRREAHQLDDLASQAWLRRRVAETADEPAPEAGTHPTDHEEVHQ